jgi:hypothetical protein
MIRIKERRNFSGEGAPTASKTTQLGATSRNKKIPNPRSLGEEIGAYEATAAMPGNINVADMPLEIDIDPLLKDIVFSEDLEQKKLVHRLYRDIYYNDPVGGSAVDLMSNLPFSDFTLGGVRDPKILRSFQETLERLNFRTIMPEISTDYLVGGTHLSSLLFDKSKGKFIDIMPHRIDNAKIEPLPFYGQDPLITVAIPEHIRTTMARSDSKRMERLRGSLGTGITELLQQEAIELDPISTLYLPRRSFSTEEGTSWFRRILPMYLLEKNLFRGTLVESSRRQRGILHLSLGDGDQWEPTVEDMDYMTELFMNADADPLGAIIATRTGVSVEELRQGGDFWKVTDTWDSTSAFKLRALGISETFLSGESTYANTESGLTVFVDTMRAYREMFTRKLIYNKIFPLVSMVNGYALSSRGKIVHKSGLMDGSTDDVLATMQDGSRLLIPSVHWAKQLKPEGDASYMEMLQNLTTLGVPVPLRALAAAGGFNLDELLLQQDDNLDQQKLLLAYQKQLAEVKKEYGPTAAPGEGEGFASAASADRQSEIFGTAIAQDPKLNKIRKNILMSQKGQGATHFGRHKPNLLSREFGEESEISGQDKLGRRKFVPSVSQKRTQERQNKTISKAMAEIARKGKHTL